MVRASRNRGAAAESQLEPGAAAHLRRSAERYAVMQVGGSRAIAAQRPLPVVAVKLADLAAQLEAGGAISPAVDGLSERQRYQVAILIEHAVERAEAEKVPMPVVGALREVARSWDRAAEVTGPPAYRAYIAADRPAGVMPVDLGA